MTVARRARVSTRTTVLFVISALALAMSAAYLVGPFVSSVRAAAPVVVLKADTNGCNGVVTTPGSENTTKELVGGTLEPGGTATFRFTFPATVDGNPGQEEWKLTDCVFVDDKAFQKFTVTALENDVSPVIIEFTLDIPADAPVGGEYCNYGKTTETPSDPQASNRKAGPACFVIGGALRVTKVDGAGQPLAGATFDVGCDWPNVQTGTFLPDTVLSVPTDGSIGGGASSETINSTDDGSFSRTVVTGDEGVISVNGPEGSQCTFTETAAPDGYDLPADPACSVTISAGEQATCEFENDLTPTPTPTPTATPTASPTPEGTVQGSTATPTPTAEQSVQGGTGTPGASQPDTATPFGQGPTLVATVAFAAILLMGLMTLAFANVRSARRRY
jgi:hypothetical protein